MGVTKRLHHFQRPTLHDENTDFILADQHVHLKCMSSLWWLEMMTLRCALLGRLIYRTRGLP
jgi:hypothetical protein